MDKKQLIMVIALLLLSFMFMMVHEFGHFYTARYYGCNASMHFFKTTEATKNNTFFSRGFGYTEVSSVKGERKEIIERKIKLAGMWFELVFLGIISTIVFIICCKREDLLLFILTGIMFAVIWSLIISWNIFNPIYGTDLYYLLMGGGI